MRNTKSSCGRGGFECNIEPMDSTQGWKKAHSHNSSGLTHGQRSEEVRCRDPSSEKLEE